MNHSDFEKEQKPPKPSNNSFKPADGSLDFELQPMANRQTTAPGQYEQAMSIEGDADIFNDNLEQIENSAQKAAKPDKRRIGKRRNTAYSSGNDSKPMKSKLMDHNDQILSENDAVEL